MKVNFEAFAADLMQKLDSIFTDFELTRPQRDGGRDALGEYQINIESNANYPLPMFCSLEAKCFKPNGKAVCVEYMSRLISRIKYREFGIMVTTNYVGKLAYKEVIEDGHPILIITASDIARILKQNSINSQNIEQHLQYIDENDERFTKTMQH